MTIKEDEFGDAHIKGTRIYVYHIVQYQEDGFDAEEIADEFDLDTEAVEEAIAYADEEK